MKRLRACLRSAVSPHGTHSTRRPILTSAVSAVVDFCLGPPWWIVAWRAGLTSLLQSSLTRAVVFSGMTTAMAFGSLWFSTDPGKSSMGKLMALALACTMAAAAVLHPALMGPPRARKC